VDVDVDETVDVDVDVEVTIGTYVFNTLLTWLAVRAVLNIAKSSKYADAKSSLLLMLLPMKQFDR